MSSILLAHDRPRAHSRGHSGFTLLEMMAVVLIIALLSGIALPNLGIFRARALRMEARDLSGQMALARQQAIVTGKPHRLLIDLDHSSYWIEWWVSDAEAEDRPPGPPEPRDPGAPLDLLPPRDETYAYRPIPYQFGRETVLDPRFYFDGVESGGEWIKEGTAQVVFDRDGSTDPSEIVITDEDGYAVALEVNPLLETVKIHDESD